MVTNPAARIQYPGTRPDSRPVIPLDYVIALSAGARKLSDFISDRLFVQMTVNIWKSRQSYIQAYKVRYVNAQNLIDFIIGRLNPGTRLGNPATGIKSLDL